MLTELKKSNPVSATHIAHTWPQYAVRMEAFARAKMGKEFEAGLWAEFERGVHERLIKGARNYGDTSFNAKIRETIGQILAEMEDGAGGWGSIAWAQLDARNKIRLMIILIKAFQVWHELREFEREL